MKKRIKETVLADEYDLTCACRVLIHEALINGSDDNITVVGRGVSPTSDTSR